MGLVLSILSKAGQAALGVQVDLELRTVQVEAVEAMEDQEKQLSISRMVLAITRWAVPITMVVTVARALNRPYPVPPIFMAAVAAAVAIYRCTISLALEDWVAAGQGGVPARSRVTLLMTQV